MQRAAGGHRPKSLLTCAEAGWPVQLGAEAVAPRCAASMSAMAMPMACAPCCSGGWPTRPRPTLVTGLKRELELLQPGAGRGRRRGAGVRPVDAAQPRRAAAAAGSGRAGALCRPPQGRPGAAACGAAGLHRLRPAGVHQPADGPAAARALSRLGAGRRLWRQPDARGRRAGRRHGPGRGRSASSCACWARASTTTPMATRPATSTSRRSCCTPGCRAMRTRWTCCATTASAASSTPCAAPTCSRRWRNRCMPPAPARAGCVCPTRPGAGASSARWPTNWRRAHRSRRHAVLKADRRGGYVVSLRAPPARARRRRRVLPPLRRRRPRRRGGHRPPAGRRRWSASSPSCPRRAGVAEAAPAPGLDAASQRRMVGVAAPARSARS